MKRPSPHSCCRKKSVPPPLAGGGECCERSEKHSGEGALLTDPSPKFFAADAARICPLPRGRGDAFMPKSEWQILNSTAAANVEPQDVVLTRREGDQHERIWKQPLNGCLGFPASRTCGRIEKQMRGVEFAPKRFRLRVRCPSRDSRPSSRADSWAGICGRCCAAPSPWACAADCADTSRCDG